jgi:hypothetical protein
MRTRNIAIGVGVGIAIALSFGQGQLGGGGLPRVVTSSDFTGSGTTGNPLDMSTAVTLPGSLTVAGATTFSNGPAGINSYAGTHLEWTYEGVELRSGSFATNASAGSHWIEASGTSADCNSLSTSTTRTRPGITKCDTGSTSTGRGGVSLSSTSFAFNGTTTSTFSTVLDVPTNLSDGTNGFAWWAGFWDTTTSVDQVDGCYFLSDERNVATGGQNGTNTQKLQVVCSGGSTRTIKLLDGVSTCENSFGTSGNVTIAADTYIGLRVVVESTTLARFYVNTAGTWTEVCQLTTNIPTTGEYVGSGVTMLKSVGSTAREIEIDWMLTSIDLTAARNP